MYKTIDIRELIPHREPFLLIDQIVDYSPGVALHAQRSVSESDYWFKGHFPGFPIMPGVLVTEALAQSCAAFLALEAKSITDTQKLAADQVYVLLHSDIKFPKAVFPGAPLELRVKIVSDSDAFREFKVQALQSGKICARGTLKVSATSLQAVDHTKAQPA
ncbi:3-hydroxyacyl-ACP dehydratase FabZ family protein [Microbulbifer sp. HZ11]|uniref:3-hydroxyacyl-ACP dehydratase FabZ family protein n=1 Tax=unclassified Microbulbifer TaxID=2619833 RepID=UPI0006897EB9|nr:3-hydroxyacyl-ACP dehydratase FabZ family protein [Microbulbifer sp. HZ11]